VSLLREGAGSDGADDRARTRARAALTEAATLDPGSSDALAWLAYADMLRDDGLAEAEKTIGRAIALSPGRLDYRLRQADILMLQDRLAEARVILTDVAAAAADPAIADGAVRRLALLDRRR
jgi:Flp pilus assembly protein TadD